MFARSGYFAQGELSQRCHGAVRTAGTKGISAEELALQAMREKELDPADAKTRSDFIRRFHWAMDRLHRTQIVRRIGKGAGVRWALREDEAKALRPVSATRSDKKIKRLGRSTFPLCIFRAEVCRV
jgi:hypothetical protein